MFTVARLAAVLQQFNRPAYCLAYSGGLDSEVLLHALTQLAPVLGFNLRAVHINHGLTAQAEAFAAHCQASCAQLQVPCQIITVQVKDNLAGQGLEAAARQARYAALANVLAKGEGLLTAHHQDDQAETLLLQLLRGTGVKGLAAMPVWQAWQQGYLGRPLLAVSRAELRAYAEAHQLAWIDDASNCAEQFDRNYLRHRVLPLFTSRWPAATQALARTAGHCAEAQSLLDEYAGLLQQNTQGNAAGTLAQQKLLQLSAAQQRLVLRNWLAQRGLPMPPVTKLQQIQADLLFAKADACPEVRWGDAWVRRYQGDLYAGQQEPCHDPKIILPWPLLKSPMPGQTATALALPAGLGSLQAQAQIGQGIAVARLSAARLTVKFRQGGERCQPAGRAHSQALKKLLQAWQIPPWQRDRVPLLYDQTELVAVVGYCSCAAYAAQADEVGWIVKQQKFYDEHHE